MRFIRHFDIVDINGDVMRFDKHELILIKTVIFKRFITKHYSFYIYTFNQLISELSTHSINTTHYDCIISGFSVITQIIPFHTGTRLCISKSQFDTEFKHRWIA